MTRQPPADFSLRLYRRLARAFPYEFRNAWEDQMLQMTEESIDQVWQSHGLRGLFRLLLDICLRVPAEHFTELGLDLRHALRSLLRARAFTFVAVLSLSLGICIATSAFSEMNGFLLRDVPAIAAPSELVSLSAPIAYPEQTRYSNRPDLFSASAAYLAPTPLAITTDGTTSRAWGHIVTPAYFQTLGVHPALGSFFGPEPNPSPEVVISHRFWKGKFSADPAIVGKTLRINGHAVTIIGVGPKDFLGASPMVYLADLWMPVSTNPAILPELTGTILTSRERPVFHFFARLKQGVTTQRADSELEAIAHRIDDETSDPDRALKERRVQLLPGGKLMPVRKQDIAMLTGFFTILGGLVLLIAGSNVANMMTARAADRRREIAVRLALGAGRSRLTRQILTESLLLSILGAVLGFLLSLWLMRHLSHLTLPYPMPLTFDLEPDARVLGFTIGLAIVAGLILGLVPALQATRPDLTPALKEGGLVRIPGFRSFGLRNALVLFQIASSLTLLLITGVLSLGFVRTVGTEVGFLSRNVSLISLDLARTVTNGYPPARAADFFLRLTERIKLDSAITAVSVADTVPMTMIGKPSVSFRASPAAEIRGGRRFIVGRDFFTTLGIPIVRGRAFREQDEIGSGASTAIVSEKLAAQCWPGLDPIGQTLEIGGEGVPGFRIGAAQNHSSRHTVISGGSRLVQVIGIAKNERDGVTMIASDSPPIIYLPMRPETYAAPSRSGFTLILRATPGADALAIARREIHALDPALTPFNATTLPAQIEQLMFPVRASVWTYACIGLAGLILASVGLAGVTAYSVSRRTREIGIRVAIGARAVDIVRLVMKEGVILVTVGSMIGLGFAWAGTRLLSSILEQYARASGATSSDPALLLGAPLLLAALALFACYVPARKSLKIDAAVALRQE